MVALPAPYDATAGTKASAAAFDAGVKDVFGFILDPPRCELTMIANTALGAGTATLIAWDSELSDTDAMHNTGANISRVTIVTPGRYEFNLFCNLTATTASTQLDINMRSNSGGSSAGGTSVRTWPFGAPGGTARQHVVSFTKYCGTIGEYFEWFITCGSAATLQGNVGVLATGLQVQFRSLN